MDIGVSRRTNHELTFSLKSKVWSLKSEKDKI